MGREERLAQKHFDRTWAWLALRGEVDVAGGAEYCRVWELWKAGGRQFDCVGLIRREANRGPQAPSGGPVNG